MLVQWTVRWRYASLLSGLDSFRSNVASAPLQDCLGHWIARATSSDVASGVSPTIDNGDDRHKLRDLKYAADAIPKLCDLRRKARYGQHLLCAILFEQGIQALSDGAPTAESSPNLLLRRHLNLLRHNSAYQTALYKADGHHVDWMMVERLFYTAITLADEDALMCY